MWCSYGGSAGHSGLFGLDIDEGITPNRHWQLELLQPDEIRGHAADRKSRDKDAEQQAAIENAMKRIVRAMLKYPDGETEKTIKDTAGVSGTVAREAFAELLITASIVPVDITKGRRKSPYRGYKIGQSKDE